MSFEPSAEVIRLLVKEVPVPVAFFDMEMRYILVSNRWMQDFNLGEKNIIGLSHYEVFPNLPEEWKPLHQRGLAGETLKNDNDSFTRPDGKKEYVRWEIVPWRDLSDAIGGIIMFSEPVTKLRELEHELTRRVQELEIENAAMINRELKMVDLKKELDELKRASGT